MVRWYREEREGGRREGIMNGRRGVKGGGIYRDGIGREKRDEVEEIREKGPVLTGNGRGGGEKNRVWDIERG